MMIQARGLPQTGSGKRGAGDRGAKANSSNWSLTAGELDHYKKL